MSAVNSYTLNLMLLSARASAKARHAKLDGMASVLRNTPNRSIEASIKVTSDIVVLAKELAYFEGIADTLEMVLDVGVTSDSRMYEVVKGMLV